MFSFHKPKIYRSSLGCCICKAKSSSSRFTDSKKYEAEFERCFRIEEERSGEICNACVLLVKRWKKLSPENRLSKHWHHVVDARAGPGTKLNTNRRLINNNNNNNHGSAAASGSKDSHRASKGSAGSASEHAYGKSDVLPLSSSQSGNHQGSGASTSHASTSTANYNNNNNNNASTSHSQHNNNHHHNQHHLTTPSKRTSSFSKALAIDTNVSTFTFGEPRRKTYGESYNPYAATHLYPASSYATINANNNYNNGYNANGSNNYNFYSNSTFTKPQSALSSSAFESVMKRFRQRQQQQQLRAKKRQQQHQKQASQKSSSQQSQEFNKSTLTPSKEGEENDARVSAKSAQVASSSSNSKRSNRCLESSLVSPDGFRISSVLDSSIWKKERTCCGTIFRGLNREVAIFPRLFKPCEHRLRLLLKQDQCESATIDQDICNEDEEPSPRTIKSGSISSCDSHTSGTGSMEQANFEPSQPAAAVPTQASCNSRLANASRPNISKKSVAIASPQAVSATTTSTATSGNSNADKQRPKPRNIPTIATRSQRSRSSAPKSSISQQQHPDEQINSSPSDDIASTASDNSASSISALSNSIHIQLDNRDYNNEQDEDDDTGDEAEIVEEMEEDDDDEDVDEEDFDEELEGGELSGPAGAISDLAAGSSALMVHEEDSTDASCSVDSLVGGQKATVG